MAEKKEEVKKVEVKNNIPADYELACAEYEKLITTDPAGMNAEEVIGHHEKCKRAAENKKGIAEQFYKLPVNKQYPKEVKK